MPTPSMPELPSDMPSDVPSKSKMPSLEQPPEGLEGGLDHSSFQSALNNLLGEIDTLPPAEQDRLREVAEATRQRHTQLKETIGKLQETLDFLRLSTKYLVFDLEATRRENTYLRKMLEEAAGED